MVTFTLTPEKTALLIDIMQSSYSDLREEIINTDNHEYKEMLKIRKEAL